MNFQSTTTPPRTLAAALISQPVARRLRRPPRRPHRDPCPANSATPRPSPATAAGPGPAPPAPATPRDYRRDAARHVYGINKHRIYSGKLPPLLYAVGTLQVNLDANGQVLA